MKKYLPLSEFMEAIGESIYADFGDHSFRILAEITDIKVYYQRSYAFFTLVEKSGAEISASVSGVIWRDHFSIIKQFEKATGVNFNQNLELALEVEVQFHQRYGLRLSVISIDEKYTLGKLQQDRQNTLNRLLTEHPKTIWMRDGEYRSNNQMLKVPMVIQRIALISAPGSDGRRDFLHELENNAYGIDYSIAEFAAQVQGDAAAGQITERLGQINAQTNSFDVVAMVRGGGGSTDFSAFDDYKVALAVASCEFPVFTGIGHERNISIADLLAYSAEKTPTKCAASLTDHNLQFLAFVQNIGPQIGERATRMIEYKKQQTANLGNDILKSAQWQITREKQWLQNSAGRLQMAHPDNTLKRGFALVFKSKLHVPLAADLETGDSIEIRFADGNKTARIE